MITDAMVEQKQQEAEIDYVIQFPTAEDVVAELRWLLAHWLGAQERVMELLRQNVTLEQRVASLEDEVTRLRKNNHLEI